MKFPKLLPLCCAFFAGLACLFVVSCADDDNESQTTEKTTIVLGGIAPLSGDASNYGRIDKLVSDLIFDEINANGGINGRMIEVEWRDTQCDPALAESEAHSLINDGLSIILGDSCSGSTLAAAAQTDPSEVILFTSASSNPDIKDAGDFVFRVFPSDDTSGEALAEYANENYTKVGILTEETDYARGITTRFLEVFTNDHVDLSFPSSQTDFTGLIDQLNSENVDAVLLMPQSTVKIRQIVEGLVGNWDKDVFGNEILTLDQQITDEYAEHFETWNCVSANFIVPSSQGLDDLIADFEFEYGEELTLPNYAAATADKINILIDVLSEIDNEFDTRAIRDAIYAVQDYQGLSGDLSFDENGEVGLVYSLVVFDGHTFVPAE